jgi:hypothetical protein
MNWILACVICLMALFAYVLNDNIEPSVYACSDVAKRDPNEVQRLCDRARKNQPWMR